MTATENLPAVRSPQRALAITTADLPSMVQLAEQLQRADGMVPKQFLGNPGKILAAILTGRELGVEPMASLRAFHVVEGKPCASYDFWIARLKASGYRVEWLHRSADKVTLQLTAPDGAKHIETWDKARAVAAGLWNGKDPWKKYPETMLTARCVTSAGRAFAAEVMFGCYELDEMDDLQRESAGARDPSLPQPQGLAAVVGVGADESAALAAAVQADLKTLGYTPAGLGDLCKELQLAGLAGKRLGDFPVEALQKLRERLTKEMAFETLAQAKTAITGAKDLVALERVGSRVLASNFEEDDAKAVQAALGERAESLRHFADEVSAS